MQWVRVCVSTFGVVIRLIAGQIPAELPKLDTHKIERENERAGRGGKRREGQTKYLKRNSLG